MKDGEFKEIFNVKLLNRQYILKISNIRHIFFITDFNSNYNVRWKGFGFDWYNFLYSILLLFVLLTVIYFDIKILSLEILIILIIFFILLEYLVLVKYHFNSKNKSGKTWHKSISYYLMDLVLKYIIVVINIFMLLWLLDLNLMEFIEYNWWLIILYYLINLLKYIKIFSNRKLPIFYLESYIYYPYILIIIGLIYTTLNIYNKKFLEKFDYICRYIYSDIGVYWEFKDEITFYSELIEKQLMVVRVLRTIELNLLEGATWEFIYKEFGMIKEKFSPELVEEEMIYLSELMKKKKQLLKIKEENLGNFYMVLIFQKFKVNYLNKEFLFELISILPKIFLFTVNINVFYKFIFWLSCFLVFYLNNIKLLTAYVLNFYMGFSIFFGISGLLLFSYLLYKNYKLISQFLIIRTCVMVVNFLLNLFLLKIFFSLDYVEFIQYNLIYFIYIKSFMVVNFYRYLTNSKICKFFNFLNYPFIFIIILIFLQLFRCKNRFSIFVMTWIYRIYNDYLKK